MLNRNYKPLGFLTREFVRYETLPVLGKIKGLTKAKCKALDCENRDATDRIYLYNDDCNPVLGAKEMAAYCQKLAVLSQLTVTD